MTDFRAVGTIMGLAGLTAVFGMGTGGAPPVWSPESGRGTVKPPGHVMIRGRDTSASRCESCNIIRRAVAIRGAGRRMGDRDDADLGEIGAAIAFVEPARAFGALARRQRVGVVKPFGC